VLTSIIFLPIVGAIVIALFLRSARWIRYFAAAIAFANLALAIAAISLFKLTDYRALPGTPFQLVEQVDWIKKAVPSFPAEYFLGVDGLSMPMILLTALLGLAAVYASWHIQHRVREYFVLLLTLQTAVLGVFASLDFVLFFIFWELELVPMYLLIALWGTGRATYSAMKFLIFTALGTITRKAIRSPHSWIFPLGKRRVGSPSPSRISFHISAIIRLGASL